VPTRRGFFVHLGSNDNVFRATAADAQVEGEAAEGYHRRPREAGGEQTIGRHARSLDARVTRS